MTKPGVPAATSDAVAFNASTAFLTPCYGTLLSRINTKAKY